MSFEQAIAQFKEISAEELATLLTSGQRVAAFIGRPTCPYCQRFAPKLAQAQQETGATVYYVDSRPTDDKALQELRAHYHIATVPGFVLAHHGDVNVICDSSLPVEEIKALLA